MVKIEFAAAEVRHLGQALAERIEPNQVRIEQAHLQGQAVDAFLQVHPELREFRVLAGDAGRAAQGAGSGALHARP